MAQSNKNKPQAKSSPQDKKSASGKMGTQDSQRQEQAGSPQDKKSAFSKKR